MYIIDIKKEEFKDIPKTLDSEVLLEVTKDPSGAVSGYITIDPEVLKHFADNVSTEELSAMGFDKHKDKLEWVKTRADIKAKPPEVAQ